MLFLFLVTAAFASQVEDKAIFDKWKVEYGRVYETSDEEAYRFDIFQNKLRDYEYRTSHDSAVFGPGQFSDMTEKEFRALVGGTVRDDCLQANGNSTHSPSMEQARAIIEANGGDDIDWRTKGAVTPVKNQGQYGTCCLLVLLVLWKE